MIKQLAKELKNLDESPPEGIKVGVNDDDFSTIYADIEGPGKYLYLFSAPDVILKIFGNLMGLSISIFTL